MVLDNKKNGLRYLIKWIIKLGDIISINLACVIIYFVIPLYSLNRDNTLELFLLINLIYFLSATVISSRTLEENIIFFDKIIQQSIAFITLYYFLLTVSATLLNIISFKICDWLIGYLLLSGIFLCWRILFRSILKWNRRQGRNYKRIVIVGNVDKANNVYHEIKSNVYGYKVLGIFSNNKEIPASDLYKGKLSDVKEFCIKNNIDEIFCTLSNDEEANIIELINFSERNMIRFYLVPDFYGYIKRSLILNTLQTIPIIGIRTEPLQKRYNRFIKRSFDICFSFLIVVTILPVTFLFFGLLIKLTSKGPIFFKQQRTGLRGKEFTCYKFRSMVINNSSNTETTSKSDSRVTAIGHFMRKTSIDELPQFVNVLLGNMSVVGPRPHMVQQTELYNGLIDKFMIRHLIQPGITGWAQISGYRGETKTIVQMEGRFKKDVWYLENWTFTLDLKIIVVTIFQIIKGNNQAY